ncbi:MAG: ABC transporter ATP-binding protein [Chloroflexi bacterium]|nr:ABC transporter ATP-binding protein [Chloroflexota bacterium]
MSIRLVGITHSYGPGTRVLRDLSLVVPPGETVALTGPSGSGKTTLLAIIGLLTEPSAGRVLFDGVPARQRGASLDRIRAEMFGWVFQTANALARRTAVDNAALGLLIRGYGHVEARTRARAALDAVGVGHLAQKEARLLSGGELQRVCIARALAARPRFILADEPTGQLDHATTLEVIEALLERRPAGTGVILATHDLEVAGRCARIVRIVDGRLVEEAR